MKKILLSFLLFAFAIFAGSLFAHKHPEHSDSVKIPKIENQVDTAIQHQMVEHQQMEAIDAFPNYHPLIVHFPIVLLLIAFLFQVLSFFAYKTEFGLVTLILLSLGVVTAWLSSNIFHAHPEELAGNAKVIFETHEQMANLTLWFSFLALIGKIISHFIMKRKFLLEIAVSLLLFSSGVTVSIAGHHGAMLVHMEGIGPKGNHLENHHGH